LPTVLIAFASAVALRCVADYVFVRQTDRIYARLVKTFHRDILSMDTVVPNIIVGARNIDSVFRDYMDGTIAIFRIIKSDILPVLVSVLGSIAVLLFFAPFASLVIFLFFVIQLVIAWIAMDRVATYKKKARIIYDELSSKMSDHILNLDMIRISGQQENMNVQIASLAAKEAALFWKRHYIFNSFEFLKFLVMAICVTLAFASIIASDNKENAASAALAVLVFTSVVLAAALDAPEILLRLGGQITRIESALATLGFGPIGAAASRHFIDSSASDLQIQMTDVSFTYTVPSSGKAEIAEGRPVIEDLNLSLKKGDHVAILGPNGAGKSSLLRLIAGLEQPSAGQITTFLEDTGAKGRSHSMNHVALVPQGAMLLDATIEENVSLFNPQASLDAFHSACVVAQLHEVVADKAEGLAAIVGERGNKLSGGQRQRVAIARALLRDASIYLLDEATSEIDPDGQKTIIQGVRNSLRGKTLIVVTHSQDVADLFEIRYELNDSHLTQY
jgi:ABC-type multidrug transport system fused ATPase/permease subunit